MSTQIYWVYPQWRSYSTLLWKFPGISIQDPFHKRTISPHFLTCIPKTSQMKHAYISVDWNESESHHPIPLHISPVSADPGRPIAKWAWKDFSKLAPYFKRTIETDFTFRSSPTSKPSCLPGTYAGFCPYTTYLWSYVRICAIGMG